MGEARRRGSFEVRKAEAIKAGRDPKVRRATQREARVAKARFKDEYLDFIRRFLVEKQEAERRMAREALRRVSLEG